MLLNFVISFLEIRGKFLKKGLYNYWYPVVKVKLISAFVDQGGEVVDKIMLIKDVHGPEAWVRKNVEN